VIRSTYVIEKRTARFGRAVALLRSGHCTLPEAEAARLKTYLGSALGGDARLLATATDETDYLEKLRSGLYDVAILVSLDVSGTICSTTEDTTARVAIGRELTELVHAGRMGALVVRTRPDDVPKIREMTGVDLRGTNGGGPIFVAQTPLGPAMELRADSDSTRLKLYGATPLATYSGGDVAAAYESMGLGRAVTFGFDVSLATGGDSAAALLARAQDWVAPTSSLAPLSIAEIEIVVTNPASPSQTRVQETLAAGLSPVATLPPASVSVAPPQLEWWTTLDQDASATFRYLTRLPEETGTYATRTDVGALLAGGVRNVASRQFDLVLVESPADLRSEARAALAQLPSSADTTRGKISALLDQIDLRAVTDRTAAAQNISDLLDAVDLAKTVGSPEGESLRFALDELVRYWEARWYLI
jgi:hypothetical protein